MKTRKAFASVEILVAIVLVVVVALIIFFVQSNRSEEDVTTDPYMTDKTVTSPSPVSEDTDIDTLEQELDDTEVGEVEADINSMEEEASGL